MDDLFGHGGSRQRRREDWARSLGWGGSKALVPCERETCPRCSTPLTVMTVTEGALFRHGGYGADRVTTFRTCPDCSWSTTPDVTEARPA